ncbi:hypothetical protein [Rhodopila globiformis]|jgi:hypothetical protein|uniref:hypothetical protein n=1 Tax=Rhodopila globiformis TaxID=1071 RepID=UPI0011AFE6FB|nr:hypothetical protein [Rhodopila globiformis]
MTNEGESPDTAIDRLEKALERIARLTTMAPAVQPEDAVTSSRAESLVGEVAEELDALIDHLRASIPAK